MGKRKTLRLEGELSQLKSHTFPKHFLFFDTETNSTPDENGIVDFKLRLGVAIFVQFDKDCKIKKRVVEKFTDKYEFIDILNKYTKKRQLLYVFAHNVGFDIRVLNLPEIFSTLNYSSEPPIINSLVFIWRVTTDNGNIIFLDTANYGVISVAQLGKDLKFPKMEIDLATDDLLKLFEYCENDVNILVKFIENFLTFLHINNLGSFKTTLASQAMCVYRTSFMEIPPYIHNNKFALQLEREAYHGGRVECFNIGKLPEGEYYYLDVNSMYPYAMTAYDLPLEFKGYTVDVPLEYLNSRLNNYYVIADVTLETTEPFCSYLHNGKLIFPTGTIRSVLHHDELLYAQCKGYTKYIHRCSVYSKGKPFDNYVEYFYDLKKRFTITGDTSNRYITKLFLNSLYGKFGQQEPYREFLYETNKGIVWRVPTVNRETTEHTVEICWDGKVYREGKLGETYFSCPSIAGSITANARMLLWFYILCAELHNVFYCDTDSIITNRNGYDNLLPYIIKDELGMLNLEETGSHLVIHGNKDYEFGGNIKIKGIPKSAIKIDENKWEYLQFQGFITWLNNGAIGNPIGWKTTKQRRNSYDKGIVSKTGRVYPHNFVS